MRNLLVGVPFLLFGTFATFAFFGMQREDPDILPSINISILCARYVKKIAQKLNKNSSKYQ